MKSVAIIGAGFAGLSVCFYLLEKNYEVTLFDPSRIGQNASSIATGLMHPYIGKFPKRSKFASEGMESTKKLLQISQDALNQKVFDEGGIFRPAMTLAQKKAFQRICRKYEDAEWFDEEQVQKKIPEIAPFGGMFIKSGITVNSKLYMQGLLQTVIERGAERVMQKVHSLEELEDFDEIVITAGFESTQFLKDSHFKKIKGQMLICDSKEQALPQMSIIGLGHITPFNGQCYIGSTYEHDFANAKTNQKADKLLEKISLFYPPAKQLEILERKAGIRLTTDVGYLPFMKQEKNIWALCAFGSRGLLYHGLYGEKLAEKLGTEVT